MNETVRTAMRRRPGPREAAAMSAVSRMPGRKAMVVVVGGPGESSRGKLMDMVALREAVDGGLEPTATAGDSGQTVRIEDVFLGYDTQGELPVLFVDDVDGNETLTMYLYAMVA